MSIKNFSVVLILGIFLIFSLSHISAEPVCCQQLSSGEWCQYADSSECNSELGMSSTICQETSYCQLGTCVIADEGACMQNTPKSVCENKGGYWDQRPKDEIGICQNGCCFIGQETAFVTQTECKQLATDYGIETSFRSDIQDELSCFSSSIPNVEGACIFEEEFSRGCKRLTKQDCLSSAGEFHEEFLCTAPHLETDCAKTENTICKDDQVYFLDSCGNLANVYDSDLFENDELEYVVEDYWTKIRDPICSVDIEGKESCGNCNYIDGTVCKEFDWKDGSTAEPDLGNYVCADLGCTYSTDGETEEEYEHGESWCAYSEGAYPGIEVNSLIGSFLQENYSNILGDQSKYNLPGSRYVKLTCMNGEVIEEPCKDYRNEYCVESTYSEGFGVAECRANGWRECFSQTDQETCETEHDCKWIPGYRWDGYINTTNTDRKQEIQGSCVPLISPGFNFWEEGNDGVSICSSASVTEPVFYELHWTEPRNKFEDFSVDTAAANCLENCYLIPGYGNGDLDSTMAVYKGEASVNEKIISERQGQYCQNNKGNPALGGTSGKVSCAGDINDQGFLDILIRRDYPVFFTHDEWLASIRERSRSMGDCGYKLGISGEYSNPDSEIISAIFQKLGQKGNVKSESSEEKIYAGDELVNEGYRGYFNAEDNTNLDSEEDEGYYGQH
jgi:hypothetical protein